MSHSKGAVVCGSFAVTRYLRIIVIDLSLFTVFNTFGQEILDLPV